MQCRLPLYAAFSLLPLAFGAALPVNAQAQTAPKAASLPPLTERMNEFPSLCQHDERGGFLGNGAGFCGPVAASNALVWLAAHGYPRLLLGENGDTLYGGVAYASQSKTLKAQIALVHALTGDNFVHMGGNGASPAYMAKGVRAYVESKGYQVERLDSAAVVNDAPADFPKTLPLLPLESIKEAFQKGAVVWLAIGWYQRDGDANTFTRTGGHFVTLVGYGKDATGTVDENVLIFRDPSQRAGRNYPNEFVRLHRITGSTFGGGYFASRYGADKGRSADGRFEIISGIPLRAGMTAIIDNATIMTLKPPTTQAP